MWIKIYIKYVTWYIQSILLLSGDIETKPGPVCANLQSLSICHWNVNIITTENFIKIPILQACLTIYKFDIVCLLETYLDSTFSNIHKFDIFCLSELDL